ncbi:MAG: protein kinase [Planctomycetes bacterium]|nr:protein kinase [Planctomycetota bacterium]
MNRVLNNSVSSLLDSLLDQQEQSWRRGDRSSVESLLQVSSLPASSDAILDLIYNEIVLREELGERPTLEEYASRYPELREDLQLHFDVHRVLQEQMLGETAHLNDTEISSDSIPLPSETGPTLADYDIIAELGRGGMGVVYKARHRKLDRFVALKMIDHERTPSPRALARFRAEAETIARMQHPNIVQIFEIGQDKGFPFLALELAEKGTLAQRLQELPYTPQAAAELIETLARSIHHAHEHRIIHRDLKPANVLFTRDGVPKITDFGLAKLLGDDLEVPRDATRSGEPIGTPRYMSPEQAAGRTKDLSPATDVYALGTILYECLTGQVPFVSSSALETMDKIRCDEPTSLRKLQRAVPRDLETICLKCLQKQSAKRYSSALELADDLRRFLDGMPIQACPTPRWRHIAMWSRRRPTVATLIAVSIAAFFATTIILGVQWHEEQKRVAALRDEVGVLMKEGREAVELRDNRTAQARFLRAWSLVLAEPDLHDQVAHVSGWLDHSRRDAEQQRWKLRQPPLLFDERRDEAFLQSVILDPQRKESVPAAREAIQAALGFTIENDPAWDLEREHLVLLDVNLLLREGEPAQALAIMDQTKRISSRTWHDQRAVCLERLNRPAEAEQARRRAEEFPPDAIFQILLSGIDRLWTRDIRKALSDFDRVLTLDPNHFVARFFLGVCYLHLQQPSEAKIALTACIAQRPRFAWNYLFRGEAYLQSKDHLAAAQDFQIASEMSLPETSQRVLERQLLKLGESLTALPRAEQDELWNEKIQTESGLVRLRDIVTFQHLQR